MQKNFSVNLFLITFLILQPLLIFLSFFFCFVQNAFKKADFGATCESFKPKMTIRYTYMFHEK